MGQDGSHHLGFILTVGAQTLPFGLVGAHQVAELAVQPGDQATQFLTVQGIVEVAADLDLGAGLIQQGKGFAGLRTARIMQ